MQFNFDNYKPIVVNKLRSADFSILYYWFNLQTTNSRPVLRKILLFITCTLILISTRAQSPLGDEGNQLSLSSGYTIEGIPIYISYEMGIHESISFGMEAVFRSYNESGDTADYAHTIMGFNFFGNYYFNKLLKLDEKKWGVYGGLNLGYYKWFSPKGYWPEGNSSSTLGIGAQIGGRYYFSEWAVFMQVSGGTENAGARLGVTYLFN